MSGFSINFPTNKHEKTNHTRYALPNLARVCRVGKVRGVTLKTKY
jgi:hypothetical protein